MVQRISEYAVQAKLDSSAFDAAVNNIRRGFNDMAEAAKKAEVGEASQQRQLSQTENSFRRFTGTLDSTIKSQLDYDRAMNRLQRGFERGFVDENERVRLLDLAKQKYQILTPAIDANANAMLAHADATKLTKMQILTLQYTINDVVASLASGASPLTILLQQGGQVTQAWGGLTNTLKALLTPARLAGLSLAGIGVALGVAVKSANDAESQLLSMNGYLVSVGKSADLTRTQLNNMATGVEKLNNLSRSDALKSLSLVFQDRAIGPEMYERLIKLASDYAVVTGKDVPTALGELIRGFRDSSRFAGELRDKFGLFTLAQYEAIKAMRESGNGYAAGIKVLSALEERIGGLRERELTPMGKSIEHLRTVWLDLTGSFSNIEWVNKLMGGIAIVIEGWAKLLAALRGGKDANGVTFGLDKLDAEIQSLLKERRGLAPEDSKTASYLDEKIQSLLKERDVLRAQRDAALGVNPFGTSSPQIKDTRTTAEEEAARKKALDDQASIRKFVEEDARREGQELEKRNSSLDEELLRLKEAANAYADGSEYARAWAAEASRIREIMKGASEEEVDYALKIAEAQFKITEASKESYKQREADAKRFKEQIQEVSNTIGKTLAQAFVEGKDAMGTFRQAYLQMVEELLQKRVLSPLIDSSLTWASSQISGTGAGDFFSSFFSLFGGGKASGGTVYPGHSYDVGEAGRETFTPSVQGTISKPQSSASDKPININVTVSGPAASNPATARQSGSIIAMAIKSEFSRMLDDEMRAGGKLWNPS